MKKIYTLILFTVSVFMFSQSKLTVYSAVDAKPLPYASVFCNGKLLGKTDRTGVVSFRTKCKNVDVKASGFYEDDVLVDKVMEITLAKADAKIGNIEKIILKDKSDSRALALLQKVREHYKENSPQSLTSYAFKSYEKIALDFDKDSISNYNSYIHKRIDSLKAIPFKKQTAKEKKDSLEAQNVMKLMGTSKLFLWERAQEFKFSKKLGEKITVLDNRVSGLQDSVYEMMTLRSNRLKMPKEVQEESQNLYRYFLTDTIDIEGRQNYVIRFRQVTYKEPINKRKFNGYIYVDSQSYGLKKIESNSKIKSEGNITSVWVPIQDKWFLQKESMKMKAGKMSFTEKEKTEQQQKQKKNYGYYVYRTADYFDYKTPIEENPKDFKGYTLEVENSDGKLLDQYRTDTLSAREKNTYIKIDSVGRKYKLDRKAGFFSRLLSGKIRAGIIDFDAGQIAKYNLYEGLRLGIGAKLNEKFSRYISPDAYAAYGFKDGGFKYGFGVDVRTTLRKNSFFRAEYYSDVMAAGRFNENLWNFKMKMMNSGVDLKNDRFYAYEGFKLSYENDFFNSLTVRLSAAKDREEAKFNYDFKGLGNNFDNTSAAITLKYAPKSKNVMTPAGKYTYEQNFPEVFFNFEKGLKTLGGDFSYHKYDLLLAHKFKTNWGVTGVRAYAGLVGGEVPVWQHFQMNGLGAGKDAFNFNFNSYLGFATMEAGRYYNDRFAGFYFTHRIPWYFKSFGQNTSSFDLVYRGIIGNMKHPEFHHFHFNKLDHFYQETGFEWNNFLSSSFNLGFFYRVGYYKTANFKENFAVQLKFKFLEF